MAALERLTDEQTPLLSDLNRAAPSLRDLPHPPRPVLEGFAARHSRHSARTSVVGTRAFKEGAEEIAALETVAPKAQPTFKPLRQFLQTMDDRRRAIDDRRPRARWTARPRPTRATTAAAAASPGLEAIWNYPFWQGLSVNGYDGVGHMLRLGVTITECSAIITDIDPEQPDLQGLLRLARAEPSRHHDPRLHGEREHAQQAPQGGQDAGQEESASAVPPASPTRRRCPASVTSRSRRSCCRRRSSSCSTSSCRSRARASRGSRCSTTSSGGCGAGRAAQPAAGLLPRGQAPGAESGSSGQLLDFLLGQ